MSQWEACSSAESAIDPILKTDSQFTRVSVALREFTLESEQARYCGLHCILDPGMERLIGWRLDQPITCLPETDPVFSERGHNLLDVVCNRLCLTVFTLGFPLYRLGLLFFPHWQPAVWLALVPFHAFCWL